MRLPCLLYLTQLLPLPSAKQFQRRLSYIYSVFKLHLLCACLVAAFTAAMVSVHDVVGFNLFRQAFGIDLSQEELAMLFEWNSVMAKVSLLHLAAMTVTNTA